MEDPPSIINEMIQMAMGRKTPSRFCNHEGLLIFLCLLSIPIMLIPKPLVLYFRNKREARQRQ